MVVLDEKILVLCENCERYGRYGSSWRTPPTSLTLRARPQFYKTHPLLIVPIIPVTPIILVILVTPVIPVSPVTPAGKTRKIGNPNLLGIKKDTRVVGESWQNEKKSWVSKKILVR